MSKLTDLELEAISQREADASAALPVSHAQCAAMAQELLSARRRMAWLEKQLATAIRLPFCSASPVCEIEAGYASGVSDCREAIRRAGFLIEGDD